MHGLGFPQVAIGNALGRRPSTISRELRRNRPPAPGPSYLAKWAGAAAPTPSCDCSSVALTLCRLRTDNPAPLVVGDDDADLARESPVLQVTTPAAREPFAAFSRELLERLPLRREEARRAVLRHAAPSPAKPAALSLAASRTPRNAPCPCGSGKKFKRCCLGAAPTDTTARDDSVTARRSFS